VLSKSTKSAKSCPKKKKKKKKKTMTLGTCLDVYPGYTGGDINVAGKVNKVTFDGTD